MSSGLLGGGEGLGHGEQVSGKDGLVGAYLGQLHELRAGHVGRVDPSLGGLPAVSWGEGVCLWMCMFKSKCFSQK